MYLAAKNLTDKVTIDYMFLCKQNKTNGKKCSKYHGITAFCNFSCKIDFFSTLEIYIQYEIVITRAIKFQIYIGNYCFQNPGLAQKSTNHIWWKHAQRSISSLLICILMQDMYLENTHMFQFKIYFL